MFPAEIATGVLHDMGNLLHILNVSSRLAVEPLAESDRAGKRLIREQPVDGLSMVPLPTPS